jgi:hypothetical protein
MMYDAEAKNRYEKEAEDRLKAVGLRVFKPWTRVELRFAQARWERKIRFLGSKV